MNGNALYEPSPSVADAENWLALGTGALLLIVGASRRSLTGACLAASSGPLLYRGVYRTARDKHGSCIKVVMKPRRVGHHD